MACEVAGRVGHQRNLFGFYFQHQVDEFGRGIPLDVEFGLDERTEFEHVVVAYVALVGAGMHGDAVGTQTLALDGKLLHVGVVLPAGIAQCGHFVYVYAEIGHVSL